MIYGVFINTARHTCIRVAEGRRYTSVIQYEAGGLRVAKLDNEVFKRGWTEMPDYPVQRAAHNYLNSIAASLETSPEARAYLELLRKAQTEDDFAQIQTNLIAIKERIMTQAETTTQATEAKKTATKTAAAKKTAAQAKGKPAAKAAAKPAAKGKVAAKPAAKAAAKPAKKTAAAKKPGRTSAFAGKSISRPAGSKEALEAVRDGTFRKALMKKICEAKKVDDVVGTTFKFNGEDRSVTSADIATAIDLGLIAVK